MFTIAIGLLFAAGAVGWTRVAPPQGQTEKGPVANEIRARRLSIVDENGKTRAAFGIMPDGEIRMEIRNKQGEVATWVGTEVMGVPALGIIGPDDKPLIQLDTFQESPMFVMRDSAGKRRLGATVTPDGTVSMFLSDQREKSRLIMKVTKDGERLLMLKDSKGKTRGTMDLEKNGTCSLDFFDAAGNPCATVQVDDKGRPLFVAWGPNGKALWSSPKYESENKK